MMQTRSFALLLLLIFVTAILAQESPYIFDTNQVDPSFFGEGDLTPSNNQQQQPGNRANGPSSLNEEEVLGYGVAPEFNTTMGGNLTRLDYKGVGTMSYSYEPMSPFGAMELSCSTGFVEPQFQGAYVGLSEQLYREAKSCGVCVEISCDDKSCGQPGKKAVATVVDLCGRCFGADMNIATPMFANLTSQDPTMEITSKQIAISWRFVDCSPYINGTIKMLVKPDGNAYFQAFSFSNSRQPIVEVALLQGNGVPPVRLRKSSSNWWEYNPGQVIDPRATYGLALLGANRQVLQVAIRGLVNQDLGVQYDLINSNSNNIPADTPPPEVTPPPEDIVTTTIIGEESEPAVVQVQEELPPVVSPSEGINGGRKMLQNDINGRITTTMKIVNTYPELLDAVDPEDLACAFEVSVPQIYQFHYGSVNFQTFSSSNTSTRRRARSASSDDSLITCGTCIQLTKRRDGGSSDATTTIMIVNDCQTCEDDEIAVNDFAFMELFRKRSGGRGVAEWKVVECEGPRGAGAGAGVVEVQQDGERSRRQTDLDDELFLSGIDDDLVIEAPAPENEEDDEGIVVGVVSQPPSIEEEQEEESSQEEEPSPSTTLQSGTAFPTMWYASSSSQQEASFYTNMACGLSGIKPPYTTNFASINLKNMYKQGSPPPCGQCAFIQCAEDENNPKCPLGKDGLAVVIVEDCGDCGPGDIRINAPSLLTTGRGAAINDNFKVMWALAGCQSSSANEDEKGEGIYVHVAPGTGSGYYEQVTFSNSAQPIVKARFNGQELKMRGYPFRWEWYEEGGKLNGSGGRVEIELEGEDGSVVRKVVDRLESQYLGVNFSE